MPNTWVDALNMYCYPVNLAVYEGAEQFPDFFNMVIDGDRNSTILFEDRFRNMAADNIPAYLEVVFWKLFSQANRRQRSTERISNFITYNEIAAGTLWASVQNFVEHPNIDNLSCIRNLLGMKSRVLAVALTLVAFADPMKFPVVDKQVAKWVNDNLHRHNEHRENLLNPFAMNHTSLQDDDFQSYLKWVLWCRETAKVLSDSTRIDWRARDIEMAVFTAQRNTLPLNTLWPA